MNPSTRRTALSCLAALALAASLPAAAQSAAPLRILVAYPPGGASDATARLLADRMSSLLARPVIVENRAGADGIIAMDAIAKAPKDGSMIGFAAISPFALTPHIRKLPFEAGQVVPLAPVMYSPALLVATPGTSAKSFEELLAQERQRPGSVRWGTSGSISLVTLILEQIRAASGVQFLAVPYKGGTQQIMDALSGQFEVMALNAAPTVMEHVKTGKLRVLAVTGARRIESLPQAPTLAELGFEKANLVSHFGLFLPAGVPATIAEQLNAVVNKVLAEPAVRAKIIDMGNVPTGGTADELAARIESESRENAQIIRRAGIKGE